MKPKKQFLGSFVMSMLLLMVLVPLPNTKVQAQNDSLILINSRKIEKNRYRKIEGSPYIFKEWKYGTVFNNRMQEIKGAYINYNGYSREFEVRKDNEYIELDDRQYFKVDVYDSPEMEEATKMVFSRGINSEYYTRFYEVLFNGKKVTLFKEHRKVVRERVQKDMADGKKVKRFTSETNYYYSVDGIVKPLKLKKKNFFNTLSHEKLLEKYIKDHKLKINNEKDLAKIFNYYEALLLVE